MYYNVQKAHDIIFRENYKIKNNIYNYRMKNDIYNQNRLELKYINMLCIADLFLAYNFLVRIDWLYFSYTVHMANTQ